MECHEIPHQQLRGSCGCGGSVGPQVSQTPAPPAHALKHPWTIIEYIVPQVVPDSTSRVPVNV